MRSLKVLERVLFVAGLAVLGFCAIAFVTGHVGSRMALAKFESEAGESASEVQRTDPKQPNFSSWDEKRVREYQASLAEHLDEPIAVLRIEKIQLEVPVFNGTSELILNRGVGRIAGTAQVGQRGNLGIAGHRDGFFRGLKDVAPGDSVQLQTKQGTSAYVIDKISIVSPNDVDVLRSSDAPAITLVTCYPFYFIGSAPKRYIVHALLAKRVEPANQGTAAIQSRSNVENKESTK